MRTRAGILPGTASNTKQQQPIPPSDPNNRSSRRQPQEASVFKTSSLISEQQEPRMQTIQRMQPAGLISSTTQIKRNRHNDPELEKRRTHVCNFTNCPKAYTKSSHLKAHERIHTGEKPYKCDFVDRDGAKCLQDFARSDELTRHKRKHTGERPFKCDFCVKSFARSDHLALHQKRHTKPPKQISKSSSKLRAKRHLHHQQMLAGHPINQHQPISAAAAVTIQQSKPMHQLVQQQSAVPGPPHSASIQEHQQQQLQHPVASRAPEEAAAYGQYADCRSPLYATSHQGHANQSASAYQQGYQAQVEQLELQGHQEQLQSIYYAAAEQQAAANQPAPQLYNPAKQHHYHHQPLPAASAAPYAPYQHHHNQHQQHQQHLNQHQHLPPVQATYQPGGQQHLNQQLHQQPHHHHHHHHNHLQHQQQHQHQMQPQQQQELMQAGYYDL